MSNVLYPLGLTQDLLVTRHDRVVSDQFEDGTTAARRLWAANNFKRQFQIKHTALAQSDQIYLRSFFTQRGTFDSFWFRDNVNRSGNANVRFSAALPETRLGAAYQPVVNLVEIAPIRALPEIDEVQTAAGIKPALWWDANRELYYLSKGTVITEPNAYDAAAQLYPAPWQSGTALPLGNVLGQWQHYAFTGTPWAKTAINIAELVGAQPACTILAIARQSTTATKQVLFAIGAMGAGAALGLAQAADNRYEPWLGGSETFTNSRQNNSAADTWRSLAIVWPASSNNVTLYVNAASIGTDTVTRSLTAGPATLGAAIDGTLIANPSGSQTNNNLAHVMLFAGALTLAQIKAVHNLLGYQYGLASVP